MSISDCRTLETKRQLVRLPNGQVIGWFEGDSFTKCVCGSKHRLRRPPAWAIDAEVFDDDVKPKATQIIIWDKESNTKWKTSVETFDKHKGTLDRGFGRQYFLPLSRFQVTEPNGNKPLQLALWGDSDG